MTIGFTRFPYAIRRRIRRRSLVGVGLVNSARENVQCLFLYYKKLTSIIPHKQPNRTHCVRGVTHCEELLRSRTGCQTMLTRQEGSKNTYAPGTSIELRMCVKPSNVYFPPWYPYPLAPTHPNGRLETASCWYVSLKTTEPDSVSLMTIRVKS